MNPDFDDFDNEEQVDEAQIKPSKNVMQQTTDQEVGSSNLPGRAN